MPTEKDIIKLLDKGNLDGAFDLVDDLDDKKAAAVLLSDYAAMIAKQYSLYDIVGKLLGKALELDPGCAPAHFNLGVLYTEPDFALEDRPMAKEAEKHYKKALELDPKDPHTHFNLGLIYAHTGRLEEARREYVKVVGLDPANTDKYDVLDGIIRQKEI